MICSTYFALPKGAENLPKSVKGAGFLNVRSSLPSCSLRSPEDSQDSKIPRFESWNLGNLGGNLGLNLFTSALASCYISRKPRGPVLENTISVAVATSTDKRGFVSSKFWGLVRMYASPLMVLGGMGLPVRMAARLRTCFQHPVHPLCLKTQKVGSLIPVGTQTMNAITQKAIRAATPSPTTGTVPIAHITDVLAAFNAANMAASYIERGSFAAARRKLTQALASINQIKLEG